MIDKLDRQVEDLSRRQSLTEGRVAVVETHLIGMQKSISNIEGNVSKFVWAVLGFLILGVLNLLIK